MMTIGQTEKHRRHQGWQQPRKSANSDEWLERRPVGAPEYRVARDLASTLATATPNTAIPAALGHVKAAIENSRYILDLEDDWDEEGATGYAPSTWSRATDFLLKNALSLWEDYGVFIASPRILPGPDGSIDLHWRVGDHELLTNIPSDVAQPASYYGNSKRGDVIKGSLDTSTNNVWLLVWLTK
jgi:hypothetical protein